MAKTYKMEINMSNGTDFDVYHPKTEASIVTTTDGGNVEEKINDLINKTNDSSNKIGALSNEVQKKVNTGDFDSFKESANSQLAGKANNTDSKRLTVAKDITGALNELFTNANNGKTTIAEAVTYKGVAASPTDTFPALATKIRQIKTDFVFSDLATSLDTLEYTSLLDRDCAFTNDGTMVILNDNKNRFCTTEGSTLSYNINTIAAKVVSGSPQFYSYDRYTDGTGTQYLFSFGSDKKCISFLNITGETIPKKIIATASAIYVLFGNKLCKYSESFNRFNKTWESNTSWVDFIVTEQNEIFVLEEMSGAVFMLDDTSGNTTSYEISGHTFLKPNQKDAQLIYVCVNNEKYLASNNWTFRFKIDTWYKNIKVLTSYNFRSASFNERIPMGFIYGTKMESRINYPSAEGFFYNCTLENTKATNEKSQRAILTHREKDFFTTQKGEHYLKSSYGIEKLKLYLRKQIA